jgi:hypothetical protein
MKKKKIYLYLCGGLGNQLFQYAAAKNLAIKNNAELILDTSTGFYTDFRDFWRFSLNKKKLKNVIFKKFVLIFFFFRVLKKFFKIKKIFNNFFHVTLINEMTENRFNANIKNFKINRNLYLMGYFQTEKYFADNKNIIIKDIFPEKTNKKKFLLLKKKMQKTNSVAIGLRFHETMPKNINFMVGGITPMSFYKKAINKIITNVKNPTFFIFSTKNDYIYKLFNYVEVLKKYNTHIVTDEEGYQGSAMENLWLMSFCKNHIFSNSTFYWWSAYFSNFRYKSKKIICSGNFPNQDTCFKNWQLKF